VLIKKHDVEVLQDVYIMDEDIESLAVTTSSQFDIHSISKLMAKAAVLNLESEERINRQSTIDTFLPDFPNGDRITIQHLLDNQSGLPREFSRDFPDLIETNIEDLIDLIKEEALMFEPGADESYSNLGYQLLYYIISLVADKPFVTYLDDEFFQPLSMDHSGAHFHLGKENLTSMVSNHEEDDGEIVVVPGIEPEGKNQSRVYSTMADLMTFLDYMKDEPFSSGQMADNGIIGFSGGGDGILAHAKTSLTSEYDVVFFSNYDEIPFGDIIATIEKIMTDQPYELPEAINRKAIKLSSEILDKYVGSYEVRAFNNDVFQFKNEGGQLVFYQNGERNSSLFAETQKSFFGEADDEDYFEFRETENGTFKLIFHYKKVEIEGERID